MEKLYTVVVKKGVDLDQLDRELASPSGSGGVPKRPVTIGNPLDGNTRTTQWLLTEDEAAELRKDERVLEVEYLVDYKVQPHGSGTIQGAMYRGDVYDLEQQIKEDFEDGKPLPLNWGLGRHQSFKDDHLMLIGGTTYDQFDPNDQSSVSYGLDIIGTYGDTYSYDYDGEGVDIVICDSGIDGDHVEWNDVNGVSRLQKIDWIEETGLNLVDDNGNTITQHDDFYTDPDGHGSSCASLAAGLKHGFAKGARIYAMKMKDLSDGVSGYSVLHGLTLIKAWHNKKQNGRPTVINMSFGSFTPVLMPQVIDHRGELIYRLVEENGNLVLENNAADIAYKTGIKGYYDPEMADVASHDVSVGMDNTYEDQTILFNIQSTAFDVAVEELIDAGCHVCIASGNNGFKLDVDTTRDDYVERSNYLGRENVGADYNNIAYAVPYSHVNEQTVYAFNYNRPSSPYSPNAFLVGNIAAEKTPSPEDGFAIWDQNVGMYTATAGNTSLSLNPHIGNKHEVKAERSAHGPAVDIWAAGSQVLSSVPMHDYWLPNETGQHSLHQPNYALSVAHYYDVPEDNLDIGVDVDTTSRSDDNRIYFRLTQALVDKLKAKGLTHIHSLRLTLNYDNNDLDLENGVSSAMSNPLDLASMFQYDYALTSHDAVAGTFTDENGDPTDGRWLIEEDGTLNQTADRLGSEYKKYKDLGLLSLQTVYQPYASQPNYTAVEPIDLNDSSNVGRILYEFMFPKTDGNYDTTPNDQLNGVDLDKLFKVTSVVVNHDADDERALAADPLFEMTGGPVYLGHANKYYSGTSMSSPMIAGMIATTIEKHGNKTPKEMKDFMLTPASGFAQQRHGIFDEADLLSRTGKTEEAEVGFGRLELEDALDDWELSSQDPNVWDFNFHDKYISYPAWNGHMNLVGHEPHNVAVVGPKVVGVPAEVDRNLEFSITGGLTFYSGAYENNSTLEMTPNDPDSVINVDYIADGEVWDIELTVNGDTYNGTKPALQDGAWIPKTFTADSGQIIGTTTNPSKGIFKTAWENTNPLNVNSTLTVTGEMLKPITDTATKTLLGARPSFDFDYSSVDVVESSTLKLFAGTFLFQPSVTAVGNYTLHIKDGLNSDWVAANGTGIETARTGVDYENENMPNPIQFVMYVEDEYGQKSDDVTVNLNITNISDTPPIVTMTPDDNVTYSTSGFGYFMVEEHSGDVELLTFTATDPDNNNPLTFKFEVENPNGTDFDSDTDNLETLFNIVFDTSDPNNMTVTFKDTNFEALPSVGTWRTWGGQTARQYLRCRIYATDADGNSSYELFDLVVKNVNEVNPSYTVGNAPHSLNVDEDTPTGTTIYTLYMNDNNDGPYAFANVSTSSGLAANETIGQLNVNSEGGVYIDNELDYESYDTSIIDVRATNRFGLATTKRIIVNVQDVFDDAPDFLDTNGNVITSDNSISIVEHSTAGTVMYHASVHTPATFTLDVVHTQGPLPRLPFNSGAPYLNIVDANGDPLTGPATEAYFTINNQWFPDYETTSVYTLQITATNEHGSNTLTVNPVVTDDPVIDTGFDVVDMSNTATPYVYEITDDRVAGDLLFTMSFTNTVYPLNGDDFTIARATQAYGDGPFNNIVGLNIDNTTGQVRLSADADISVRPQYMFIVIAYDAVTGTETQRLVTINVVPAFQGQHLHTNFYSLPNFRVITFSGSNYTGDLDVYEIPFDIGVAANKSLCIQHNMTVTNNTYRYMNDSALGLVQIFDTTGTNKLHQLYCSASGWYTLPTYGITNGNAVTINDVQNLTGPLGQMNWVAVSTSGAGRWCTAYGGTPSSNTGIQYGVGGYASGQPTFHLQTGQATEPQYQGSFLFRECSGPAQYTSNWLKSTALSLPAQGLIRIAALNTGDSTIDPNDTFRIALI